MKIKVEPFLMKKGNRVAKGAIEFDDKGSLLEGWHLIGFTICDDEKKGLFVLFPASIIKSRDNRGENDGQNKPFFFLKPANDEQIAKLESQILDVYESMTGGAFNPPRSDSKQART